MYASASHATDASGHCVRFFTQRTQAPTNRNVRSKQPIMVASASACVACVFRLRNARKRCVACVACVWMETGLNRTQVSTTSNIRESLECTAVHQVLGTVVRRYQHTVSPGLYWTRCGVSIQCRSERGDVTGRGRTLTKRAAAYGSASTWRT